MSAHQSGELNLRQAFHELNKAERTGDYERVLKTCNRILKVAQNDSLVLRYKVLSLIHLSKFEEALQFIKKITSLVSKPKSRDAGEFIFEKAYCEYRMNRPAEALKTLRDAGGELDFRCKELMAQLHYRLEEYDECYRLYKDLVKNSADEFDNEREANLLAVCAQLRYSNEHQPEVQSVAADSFEQLYNNACGLIAAKEYAEALNVLGEAEVKYNSSISNQEDHTDDELTTIKLQKAYCLHMLKQVEEASKIYALILDQKPNDPTLVAIASNNLVCIRRDQNLFDSRKKLKLCQTHQLTQKFTTRQRASICLNNTLLMYFSNQVHLCSWKILFSSGFIVTAKREMKHLVDVAHSCPQK
ncbi:unnamed protein product [Soboliphyme baturini]|uniref:Signal recognition particle subunit SRP72 n=1 Tax=Soboliphyme baturini TaxID=241478 RepID=A0A183IUT3_9BILA|nr:unnamed protein product [Soboliphyme baturini]